MNAADILFGDATKTKEAGAPPAVPPAEGKSPAELIPESQIVKDALGNDFVDRIDSIRDAQNLTEAQAGELRRAHMDAITGAVLPGRANVVHGLLVREILKPTPPEERARWMAEANRAIREKYGTQADSLKAEANSYVASNPELKRLLNETGIGSHAEVCLAIIERVRLRRLENVGRR